jgi:glycosyltransferase involved in cell wall biosynthesis
VVVSASTDPEAFGRVVAEAQALGRLVVGPDHGGAKELIIDGETGWLTPPGDATALAAAIERALSFDAAARNRAAARSIVNVRTYFSKQAMCAKTLEVYNEVLQLSSQTDQRD